MTSTIQRSNLACGTKRYLYRASDLPVASPPRAPQPSLHRPKLIPPLPPGRSQGLAHKAAAVPASQPASASGSQADPARSSQTGRQPSPAPPAGEDVPAVRSGHAAAESHAAPSSERGPSYRPEKENAANRREAMYPGQAMGPPSSRQRYHPPSDPLLLHSKYNKCK